MDSLINKWRRRASLALLERSRPQQLLAAGERRLLPAFRRAIRTPAYRTLLQEAGVDPRQITSIAELTRQCPLLSKENTFSRFPLQDLCVAGAINQLASVLTSSGLGACFAFGLSSRQQVKHAAREIDLGLQYAFDVDNHRTLLINCLPMGVRFSSNAVCIAETSVREDMALALADKVGSHFEQLILVGDPLFLKRMTDQAGRQGMDWTKHRVNLVIGEEVFGENYRSYLEYQLGIDADKSDGGFVCSSMGVGELGLNLFYETRQTVPLRRRAAQDADFSQALFGAKPRQHPLPMLFVYNPLRCHVEIINPDDTGYGELAISMTSLEQVLPLLRYSTGDIARQITPETLALACQQAGIPTPTIPFPLIAISGHGREYLPDGSHVAQYKDALYADREAARHFSGAFRLELENGQVHMHIQLARGHSPAPTRRVQYRGSCRKCRRNASPCGAMKHFPGACHWTTNANFPTTQPRSSQAFQPFRMGCLKLVLELPQVQDVRRDRAEIINLRSDFSELDAFSRQQSGQRWLHRRHKVIYACSQAFLEMSL